MDGWVCAHLSSRLEVFGHLALKLLVVVQQSNRNVVRTTWMQPHCLTSNTTHPHSPTYPGSGSVPCLCRAGMPAQHRARSCANTWSCKQTSRVNTHIQTVTKHTNLVMGRTRGALESGHVYDCFDCQTHSDEYVIINSNPRTKPVRLRCRRSRTVMPALLPSHGD